MELLDPQARLGLRDRLELQPPKAHKDLRVFRGPWDPPERLERMAPKELMAGTFVSTNHSPLAVSEERPTL